jgi:electron transfer flavoprotein alpha/beta subunit
VMAARLQPAQQFTALAATDGSAAEALAEAQSLGAFRTAQVVEVAMESLDVGALGKTLADALLHLQADLVLCGARSDVEGRGVVPAAVAHHWKAPYLALVEELSVTGDEATVVVRSGGKKRRLAVKLPALLTVGATLAVNPSPPPPATPSSVEILRLHELEDRTFNRASDLGTLERPKRKPFAATSASDLLRRW